MSARRRPKLGTVLRDSLSYGGGWVLMFGQTGFPGWFAPPSNPNELAMLLGALLIGVPGAAQLIAWKAGGTGTGGQPSAPAPSPLPSSSPTSPAEPSGAEI